jgi:hypothetical protein
MDELKKRISAALENELASIYDELGISRGDIAPEQWIDWDNATTTLAFLFAELIEQNK